MFEIAIIRRWFTQI